MLERLGVLLFSTLLIVGSLAGAVWIVATGQLQNIDGIFLMLVWLVFAGVFFLVAFSLAKSALARQPAAVNAKSAAKPAPPARAAGTMAASEAHSQPAATH